MFSDSENVAMKEKLVILLVLMALAIGGTAILIDVVKAFQCS